MAEPSRPWTEDPRVRRALAEAGMTGGRLGRKSLGTTARYSRCIRGPWLSDRLEAWTYGSPPDGPSRTRPGGGHRQTGEFHLIILDFAYVIKDQTETSVLFELISARYEQRSMLTTANQPSGQWEAIFPRPCHDRGGHRPPRAPCQPLRAQLRQLPAPQTRAPPPARRHGHDRCPRTPDRRRHSQPHLLTPTPSQVQLGSPRRCP